MALLKREEGRRVVARRGWRKVVIVAGVFGAHLILFTVLGAIQGTVMPYDPAPIIRVELISPPPVPPPPPREKPVQPKVGGGAPAAPSVVRQPPDPRPVEREVVAPPVSAPEPTLVIGASDKASPTPGQGQGGQGSGTGSGQGEGDGPGSGGSPPILVRGPSQAEILRGYPTQGRRARRSGRVELSCLVRLDRRLEQCRIVREEPQDFGFGEAALQLSRSFEFIPATRGGAPLDLQRITVGITFGPQGG